MAFANLHVYVLATKQKTEGKNKFKYFLVLSHKYGTEKLTKQFSFLANSQYQNKIFPLIS